MTSSRLNLIVLSLSGVFAVSTPSLAQECSAQLIHKWGENDVNNKAFMKPGEWELVVSAKECSKNNLARYMAQVQSATVDEPGVRMLADLKARYGSIDLIWRDKNTLHSAIGAKQTEIDGKLRQARLQKNDDKCLPVLADIGIPPDFADAVLVPESETTNLSRFLCAAAVHNGKVTITAAATDVYKVAFAGAYLKFRVIRPSRYLKDAVKTTTVEAIGNDRGEEPADISIVHYLDGQFALSFARFMAQ